MEQSRHGLVTSEYGRPRARLWGRFDVEGEVRWAVGVLQMLPHRVGGASDNGEDEGVEWGKTVVRNWSLGIGNIVAHAVGPASPVDH